MFHHGIVPPVYLMSKKYRLPRKGTFTALKVDISDTPVELAITQKLSIAYKQHLLLVQA